MKRLPLLAAAFVALFLLSPAAASAAGLIEITNTDTEVQFDAEASDANNVTVTTATGSVTVNDTTDVINLEAGSLVTTTNCTGGGTNTVTCTLATLGNFELNLNDMNDFATASGPVDGELFGEAGADNLTGSSQAALGNDINGEAGNDTLTGGAVEDFISGGDDVDTINGGAGDDFLQGDNGDGDTVQGGDGSDEVFAFTGDGNGDVQDGGPGTDEIQYSANGVTPPALPDAFALDLAAGTALTTNNTPSSDTATGFEDASTSQGNDSLSGTDGPNDLFAGGGNDVVSPRGGADVVDLGEGDDSTDVRDGNVDRVKCGSGNDSVQAEQFDTLIDCENATITQARPVGADLDPPDCTLAGVRSRYKPRRFFRGLRPRASCDEAVTMSFRIVVRVRRARGIVATRARDLVLAERNLALAPGTRSARLRPVRALRRALGRRFRARVVLEARDEFGNRDVVSRTVRVR